MSQTVRVKVVLGSGLAGLADLQATIVDDDDDTVSGPHTEGFTDFGAGYYLWAGEVPDGFEGAVKIGRPAVPVLAVELLDLPD